MKQLSPTVLLQYITQKICHDLSAPLSALRLGMDQTTQDFNSEVGNIMLQALESATTRIEVFRQLFSSSVDTFTESRASKLLQSYCGTRQIAFKSLGKAEGTYAQIMLGLGVVACETLPRGGRITMDFNDLSLKCDGPIAHLPYTSFDPHDLIAEGSGFKSAIILVYVIILASTLELTLESLQEADGLTLFFSGKEIA